MLYINVSPATLVCAVVFQPGVTCICHALDVLICMLPSPLVGKAKMELKIVKRVIRTSCNLCLQHLYDQQHSLYADAVIAVSSRSVSRIVFVTSQMVLLVQKNMFYFSCAIRDRLDARIHTDLHMARIAWCGMSKNQFVCRAMIIHFEFNFRAHRLMAGRN